MTALYSEKKEGKDRIFFLLNHQEAVAKGLVEACFDGNRILFKGEEGLEGAFVPMEDYALLKMLEIGE